VRKHDQIVVAVRVAGIATRVAVDLTQHCQADTPSGAAHPTHLGVRHADEARSVLRIRQQSRRDQGVTVASPTGPEHDAFMSSTSSAKCTQRISGLMQDRFRHDEAPTRRRLWKRSQPVNRNPKL
jgi:hypothetical protein